MSDDKIIRSIKAFGVDYKRLNEALNSNDNWGHLVHSFEYLTVLGVVEDAMREEEEGGSDAATDDR